jgi:thiamine-phosphate pyrophosphorylase
MQLIVISSPGARDGEFEAANEMLAAGLECFHLRKPGYTGQQYREALQEIKPAFLKRIMIHDHYQLAARFNVRGLHFSGEQLGKLPEAALKEVIRSARKRGLRVSRGVHSLEELNAAARLFDYLWLSPVFDSISKPGYPAAINPEEAAVFLKTYTAACEIYALGGVDEENIPQLRNAGFHGLAVLGAIWQSADPVGKFNRLQNILIE